MASNVSSEKLLFYAAAGALGGFAAWGAAEPILGIRFVYGRDVLFGALIGALISAFLASIETLSVGQWRQAARRFAVGGMIGAAGGALGLIVGELLGFFIGLVGELLKRGWLMVVRSQSRNAREGREYPLTKGVTIIGRAEESDIGLCGDRLEVGGTLFLFRERAQVAQR